MIFGINSPNDLFRKCAWDLEEVIRSRYSLRRYSYALMNFASGLNLLPEWFIKDHESSSDQKVECVIKFNPYEPHETKTLPVWFRKIYNGVPDIPRTNVHQRQIRLICNRIKHVALRHELEVGHGKAKEYGVTVGGGFYLGDPKANAGYYEKYVYIYSIDDGGTKKDVQSLCTELLRQWTTFLWPNLPVALRGKFFRPPYQD